MANTIYSAIGRKITDNGTINIYTGTGESGFVLYGPYVALPAGIYTVLFQISVESPETDVYDIPCGWADVSARGGTHTIVRKEFTPSELITAKNEISIDFHLESADSIEFRLFSYGACGFTVRADRALTPERDYLFTSDEDHVFGTDIAKLTYSEFVLQNLPRLKALASHGAMISSKDGIAVVTMCGISVFVQQADDIQVIIEILVHNTYSFGSNRPTCVIDVGMNIGLASLYFASMSFVTEVHGFEPFKAPFDRAQKNLALNIEQAKKIHAHNYGLSDQTSENTVLYNQEGTIGASILGLVEGEPSTILIRDAAEVFRGIIANARMAGLAIAVKLDCEGSEFGIFETLSVNNMLAEIDVYLIEWHKWWSKEKTQFDLLAPLLAAGFVIMDHTIAANPHAGQIYAIKARGA